MAFKKANTVEKIATMNLLQCFTLPSECMFVRNRGGKKSEKAENAVCYD